MSPDVTELIVTGIFAVLWWLLKDRDAKQQREIDALRESIKLLFSKHDADVKDLESLKLQIASQHYIKPELDAKFDRLEGAISKGFAGFGDQLEKLSGLLISHISKES